MSSHCLTLLSNFQSHSEKRKRQKKMRERKSLLCPQGPVGSISFSLSTFTWRHSSYLLTPWYNIHLLNGSRMPQAATCQSFCISDILCPGFSSLQHGGLLVFQTWSSMSSYSWPLLRKIHHLWPVPWLKATIFFYLHFTCLFLYSLSILLSFKFHREGINLLYSLPYSPVLK